MFENLKQHINRENLNLLKKKNRYLQDHHDSDPQSQSQFNCNSNNQPQSKKSHLPINLLGHGNQDNSSSEDSLSDYQLQQRQEAFHQLASQPEIQFSPLDKHKINFSDTYFTPQNKINELQKSIQLSEEKLKLTQQYHARELTTLTQKHDRKVHQLTLSLQKLQLLINQSENKQLRLKQLNQENNQLRDTLHLYEEKYWQFQELQKLLHKAQTSNKVLHLQKQTLKQQIQGIQSCPSKKQNQLIDKNLFSHQISIKIQQLQAKLKNSQRSVNILEKRLSETEHKGELDKLYYQEKIKLLERKVEELEQVSKSRQKKMCELSSECDKVKMEKEAVQKSLFKTLESFSKHLSNESTQNDLALLTRQINQSITSQYQHKSGAISHFKHSTTENEATINLEETHKFDHLNGKQFDLNDKQNKQINQISPVPVKKVSFYEPFVKEPNFQNFQPNERARVMSYQLPTTNQIYKNQGNVKRPIKLNESSCDPQKFDREKVLRLEKKLQAANKQIMKLLRQKLSWGANNNQINY